MLWGGGGWTVPLTPPSPPFTPTPVLNNFPNTLASVSRPPCHQSLGPKSTPCFLLGQELVASQ